MKETHDLPRTLDWLRRQELRNAHVISVLEGRHIPQFAALKRVLDNKPLGDINGLRHAYSKYTDSPACPSLLLVIWESEACLHWHSPPRRIIEAVGNPKAGFSCADGPIINAISNDRELCIVTNEQKIRDYVNINCSPITWHFNVVYTVEKSRFRPRKDTAVRMLTARDEKAVADFIHRAGGDEHGSTYGQFELAKRGMFYKCYGSFIKDKLVGFLTLFERTTNVWEVLWVRVDSEYRRHGVGSSLLSRATEDIFAAGKIPMYLTTPSNIPAISMISTMGFIFVYERYTAQITEVSG